MPETDQVFQTDTLLRRVSSTDPNYIRDDGTLTSLAFKPRKSDTDGVSVDIERLTTHEKAVVDREKDVKYAYCLSYDAYEGRLTAAPERHINIFRTVEANCKDIARIWGTIPEPKRKNQGGS